MKISGQGVNMVNVSQIGRDKSCRLEEWSYRFLVGAVFAITFSIALGLNLLGASFLLFAVYLVRERKLPFFPGVAWIALVFIVIAVLTCLLNINPDRGAGRLSRLIWLFAIPMSATLIYSRERLMAVITAFVIGGVVLFVKACVVKPIDALRGARAGEYGGSFLKTLIDRGSMTGGQMMMLGVLAALVLLFVSLAERRNSLVWWVLLALQVAALVVNFKRGSWICACIVVAVFVVSRTGWKGLVVVMAVIIMALATPQVRFRLKGLVEELRPDSPGRMTMWTKVAPGMIRDHPWGIGFGQLTNKMMREYAPNVERGRGHLHSNFFQILVETGWLGFFVYLAWMILAAVNGVRWLVRVWWGPPRDMIMVMGLVLMFFALIANGVVEYNFGDTEILIVLAVLIGIMGRHSLEQEFSASPAV